MSEGIRFSDAHAHPADMSGPYPGYGDAVRILGCAARPSEWDRLKSLPDPRVSRFYGVHPWYASEWGAVAEAALRSHLADDPGAGVGEIGLDSKRGDLSEQVPVFQRQLTIAKELRRPVQIHCVGCEKQVLDTLRRIRPGVPVVMHAFSNESYARPFADAGCMLSLNPRILARSPERISRLVSSVPEDRLLLESDAPSTPRGFEGIPAFARSLSEASGIPTERLLELSVINAEKVVSWRG